MKALALCLVVLALVACTPGNQVTITTDPDGNLIITGGVVVPTVEAEK